MTKLSGIYRHSSTTSRVQRGLNNSEFQADPRYRPSWTNDIRTTNTLGESLAKFHPTGTANFVERNEQW